MDIIKFTNPNHKSIMEQAEIINNIEDKLWIERYSDPGEFSFTSRLESRLKEKLPIGSFVSHTNTAEVMVVENHEVTSELGVPQTIKVTGRSFETILEGRVVGSNLPSASFIEYILPTNRLPVQITKLITDHIKVPPLLDSKNALPYLHVTTSYGLGSGQERLIKVGDLYQRVKELLEVDRLGIRTYRPGPWSPSPSSMDTIIEIYKGTDKRQEIVFEYDRGEIESADHLWSNKQFKNCVFVYGKWLFKIVDPYRLEESDRRMGYLDASDIDEKYEQHPAGGAIDQLLSLFEQRGQEYLSAQREMTLTRVNLSPAASMPTYSAYLNPYPEPQDIIQNTIWPSYRKIFDLGDIITVRSEFGELQDMRVTEVAEIEDEQGFRRQPTLALADEEDLRFT